LLVAYFLYLVSSSIIPHKTALYTPTHQTHILIYGFRNEQIFFIYSLDYNSLVPYPLAKNTILTPTGHNFVAAALEKARPCSFLSSCVQLLNLKFEI